MAKGYIKATNVIYETNYKEDEDDEDVY